LQRKASNLIKQESFKSAFSIKTLKHQVTCHTVQQLWSHYKLLFKHQLNIDLCRVNAPYSCRRESF